jgi:peptide-methionine (R)-S-oxide reductase
MTDAFNIDKDELKKKLTSEEYEITQNAGTEAPFTGKYWNEHADGTYTCKVCGQVLFDAEHKFESGSGWPSFDRAVPGSVSMREDTSHGMTRTEVVCSRCGAHLGHMFEDGPKETTGQRFCINSASLDLKKRDK